MAIGIIAVVPFDKNLRSEIVLNLIANDILSSRPSEDAKRLIGVIPDLKNIISSRNRALIIQKVLEYGKYLETNRLPHINYVPDLKDLNEYLKNSPILLNLVIPLNVINSGNQSGNLTTIILQINSTTNKKEFWLFICHYEANTEILKNPLQSKTQSDISLVDKVFPGINIPAKSSVQLNPYFVPIPIAENSIINTKPITAGVYSLSIFGYDSKAKKVLNSKVENWTIDDGFFGKQYDGFIQVQNLSISGIVAKHADLEREK